MDHLLAFGEQHSVFIEQFKKELRPELAQLHETEAETDRLIHEEHIQQDAKDAQESYDEEHRDDSEV